MKAKRKHHQKTGKKTNSFLAIVVALVCLNYLVFSHGPRLAMRATAIAQTETQDPFAPPTHTPPNSISIPSLSVSMPVHAASVVGNNWDLYTDAVSWLDTSSTPDEHGNIVIFGHNLPAIFGRLSVLSVGDEIFLKTRYETIRYVVYAKDEVTPNTLTYVVESSDRLTIYTCSGPWDSKRLFILAQPEQLPT